MVPEVANVSLAEANEAKFRLKHTDGNYILDLTTNPKNVAQSDLTVGTYLQTILFLAALTLVLSVASLPALVSNVLNSKFTTYYQPGPNVSLPIELQQGLEASACEREYSGFNFISTISYGSHCTSKERINSHFSCPAACVVNLPFNNLTRGLVPGTDDQVWDFFRDEGSVCNSLQPCDPDSTAPEDFLLNLSAATSCCHYQLNQETEDGKVPIFQFWMIFSMFLLIMVWVFGLRKHQVDLGSEVDYAKITTRDFSVLIQGLRCGASPDDCRKVHEIFEAHFDQVYGVFPTTTSGRCVRAIEKINRLRVERDEVAQVLASDWPAGSFSPYPHWLGNTLLRRPDLNQRLEDLQNAISEEELNLMSLELRTNGGAFVIFEKEASAARCLRRIASPCQRMIRRLLCKHEPFIVEGCEVTAVAAPEPSDVMWNNFMPTWNVIYLHRAAGYLLTTLILAIGLGLQYLLEGIKADERQRIRQVYVYNTEITEQNSSFAENAVMYVRLRVVTAMVALVIVIVNFIIANTMELLTQFEKYSTRSMTERLLIHKLGLAHLFNTVLAPLLVMQDPREWYIRGGLVEQAFFVQCLNAVVPNAMFLLKSVFKPMVMKRLFSRHVKTQPYLDQFYTPEDVLMGQRYSQLLKTFMIALMYSPILPISYPIALIALGINYWVDSYVMLRVAARPREMKHSVVDSFNRMVSLLLPIHLFITFRVYFHEEASAVPPLLASLLAWCLSPIDWVFIRQDQKLLKQRGGGTGDVNFSDWFKEEKEKREKEATEEVCGSGRSTTAYELYGPWRPPYGDNPTLRTCPQSFLERIRDAYPEQEDDVTTMRIGTRSAYVSTNVEAHLAHRQAGHFESHPNPLYNV